MGYKMPRVAVLAAIEKDEKRKGLAEKLKNALKQKAMRNET